jgi:cell division initiation protein
MRITPLDIRKQEFRKAMRGLDAEEVYAFLSTVGDEYESILNDNKALRERLLELDDKVQEYRTMERTLRDTLLTAERVTLESRENARREAGLIIKEAQIEAERALRGINTNAMHLRQEVSQLRGQRESYIGRMKVIAESLLRFIENVDTDFQQEEKAYGVEIADEEPVVAPLAAETENKELFKATGAKATRAAAETEIETVEMKPEPESVELKPEPVEAKPEPAPEPPASPDRDAGNTETLKRSSGVPQEMQTGTKRGFDDSSAGDTHYLADGPPEQDRSGQETRTQDQAPAAEDHNQTLSDINDIIERMADGQRELMGETRTTPSYTPTGPLTSQPQFQPIPSPPAGEVSQLSSPVRTSSSVQTLSRPWDTPSAQTSIDTLETVLPHQPVPVGGAWESVPEVATALEQPPAELPETDSRSDVPKGPGVTSEMSLEEIRRDLAKRIAHEKEDND